LFGYPFPPSDTQEGKRKRGEVFPRGGERKRNRRVIFFNLSPRARPQGKNRKRGSTPPLPLVPSKREKKRKGEYSFLNLFPAT